MRNPAILYTPELIAAAELMVAISKGRSKGILGLFRNALPLDQAILFVHNPQAFQVRGERKWVAEAITVAKLICKGSAFLNQYVCPIVEQL